MLEVIAGATLGTVVAVAAASVTHRRRVEAHLVRPKRFEKELAKFQRETASLDSRLTCNFCGHEIPAADARIIYRTAAGQQGVVCNETECLLTYMRSTVEDEPTHSEATHKSSAA